MVRRRLTAAGALDERVTIEQPATADDGYGGETVTWSAVATVWASIRPLSVADGEGQGAVRQATSYGVVIRRRGDIDETMRLTWRGRTFAIREAADPGPRALYQELVIEEGVAK